MGRRMSYFDGMSVDDLQSYYSDFHKDYFGYRPRSSTPEQWVDRDWLIEQINGIHNAMDEMKKTYNGRELLRAEGWHLEEKDFI
jgi:pyridoxine/pyridoxamine 5'-phosphate oxidase